jgi:dihydrofolate reductase
MGTLAVRGYSISLDGYGAGANQSKEEPLGAGGEALHDWLVNTKQFGTMYPKSGGAGTTGVDNDFAVQAMDNIGAWIMGRNMFGPVRGAWPDDAWKGWWGKNPPYHVPVYVLTHHARAPQEMEGGTVFHFVTDGIESALRQARAAAGAKDIRIGGGASCIRQYLEARAIDELHVAVTPILLGRGESLFGGLDLTALGYRVAKSVTGERATHYIIARK